METPALNILITGGSGKLGQELLKKYPEAIHPSHREMDIADAQSVNAYITEHKPELVIHCAAITGIRDCEENKERAWQINVQGTENLVKACQTSAGCYFVYVSTACVFRGDRGDFTENDLPYPKNFYALTKLLSEFTVKNSQLAKTLIIRTNFVAREKWPYERAFVDRFGTYLFADDLAAAMASVMEEGFTGIVHICGQEKLSMYELAKITTPDIKPMTLQEYHGPPLTENMTLRSVRIPSFKITKQ